MSIYGKLYNVAICDDEVWDLQRIREMFEEIITDSPLRFEVQSYHGSDELYQSRQAKAFDLIFLDIEMPGMDGFELVRHLHTPGMKTHCVFVSNHEDFMCDSFEYSPFGFIRKSRLKEDMQKVMERYQRMMAKWHLTYEIVHRGSHVKVPLGEILYFQCSGHDLNVKTTADMYYISGSLSSVEQCLAELENEDFVKTRRNIVVNMNYIKAIREQVILTDESKIPISKHRRKNLEEAFCRYVSRTK